MEETIVEALAELSTQFTVDRGTAQEINREGAEKATTFICHEQTKNGKQFYLAGTVLDEQGKMKEDKTILFPATPAILNLTPEERDAVSAKFEAYLDEGKVPPIWQRVSDPQMRDLIHNVCALCKEKPAIDQYNQYYKGIMNDLLRRTPQVGIERIASSMEQAVYLCHPEKHPTTPSGRDPLYVVNTLETLMKERQMPAIDFVALEAYKKAFHRGDTHTFCHTASRVAQDNGLSVRLSMHEFKELPLDIPCCTFEVFERNSDYHRPVRQAHIFLDGSEPKQEDLPYTSRQAAFLHCLENPALAEQLEWANKQVCLTAASVTALRKAIEEHPDRYPPKFLTPWRDETPRFQDAVLFIEDSPNFHCNLAFCRKRPRKDGDFHILFSGSLEDAKKMDPADISIYTYEMPVPEPRKLERVRSMDNTRTEPEPKPRDKEEPQEKPKPQIPRRERPKAPHAKELEEETIKTIRELIKKQRESGASDRDIDRALSHIRKLLPDLVKDKQPSR